MRGWLVLLVVAAAAAVFGAAPSPAIGAEWSATRIDVGRHANAQICDVKVSPTGTTYVTWMIDRRPLREDGVVRAFLARRERNRGWRFERVWQRHLRFRQGGPCPMLAPYRDAVDLIFPPERGRGLWVRRRSEDGRWSRYRAIGRRVIGDGPDTLRLPESRAIRVNARGEAIVVVDATRGSTSPNALAVLDRSASGRWSAARQIKPLPRWGIPHHFSAALGSNGDAAVTWGGPRGAQVAVRRRGAPWPQTPASLPGGCVKPPSVAVGPDGTTVAAWACDAIQAAVLRAEEQTWSAPADLDTPAPDGSSLDLRGLVAEAGGSFFAAWDRYRREGEFRPVVGHQLRAAALPAGAGDWTPAGALAPEAPGPATYKNCFYGHAVFADEDGNVLTIRAREGDDPGPLVVQTRGTSGAWSGPAELGNTTPMYGCWADVGGGVAAVAWYGKRSVGAIVATAALP